MSRLMRNRVLSDVLVVILILFLTLSFTYWEGNVLRSRFFVSLLFLVPGALALVFKEPTQRFVLWLEDLTRLSDESSKRQVSQQVARFGRWAVMTGLAIVFVAAFIAAGLLPDSISRGIAQLP